MNLFRKHAQANQEIAKDAYEQVARNVIGKYVICHEILNSALVGGNDPNDKESPCLLCKIDSITRKMSKLESQVGQLTKTYKLAFGEELDVETITDEACMKFYPMTTGKKSKSVEGKEEEDDFTGGSPLFRDIKVDEMPQELQDMISKIKSGIEKKKGGDVSVHVVGVKRGEFENFNEMMSEVLAGETYGINPKDYDSPMAYFKAVKAAAKKHKADGGMSPANVSFKAEENPLDEPIKPEKRRRNSDSEDTTGQN